MSIGYTELRDAWYRNLGLDPVFQDQGDGYFTAVNGRVASLTDAVHLVTSDGQTNVSLAVARVQLRRDSQFHSAYYEITSALNTGDTLRITLDGVNSDYIVLVTDTLNDVYLGLQAALAVNAFTSEITTYAGGTTCLRVWDTSKATSVVFAESVVGVMTADITQEATSVTFGIWTRSDEEGTFDHPEGLETFTVTDNWKQRLELSGDDYAYIELTATDGYTVIRWGLCDLPGA